MQVSQTWSHLSLRFTLTRACRFFWKMQTPPPYPTAYPSLNMPNVVPAAFVGIWESTLEAWGQKMKDAVEGVAQMAAAGLGLDGKTFTDAGKYG
jgi:isopenicillin N synthase-like dioxygenase